MTRGKNIMMTMGSDFQYEDLLFGWFRCCTSSAGSTSIEGAYF